MTRAADLAKLIAGGGTITVADNSDTLTLESTDADANVGPVLNLHRNSASPADNDLAGRIVFKADDDAGNAATFARIEATAVDVSNGGEDGRLDFFTAKDDAFTAALSVAGTDVGVGTTSPTAPLTVKAPSGAEAVHIHGRSDDIGQLVFLEADATTKIGRIDARNSVFTVGSVADIPFTFITGTSERMRVDTSGNVLIGKTAAGTAAGVQLEPTGTANIARSGDLCLVLDRLTNAGEIVSIRQGNNAVGGIDANSSSTDFNTSSDYRLKENVTTSWDATTRLNQLKPVRFSWKIDSKSEADTDGFLAHEVSSVVPQATSGEKDAVDADGNPKHQGIDHSKLVALLTKSLQEALARIDTLEAEVAKLKG